MREPTVMNQSGKLVVSSRNVAEVFEKEHKNVLRDIKAILSQDFNDANIGFVCSSFNGLNFELVEYMDGKGEMRPEYLMTKDGLMLLVMGYTGAKAMAMKIAYINRFNEMERQLKAIGFSAGDDEVGRLMGRAQKLLTLAGIEGNQLVLALDKVHKNKTGESLLALSGTQLLAPVQEQLHTPTELGKVIGLSAVKVNLMLAGKGYQVKGGAGWELTGAGKAAGGVYLDTNKRHSDGTPVRQIKWPSEILNED